MLNSITETLKKINIELKGNAFVSSLILLFILNGFLGFKILEAINFNDSLTIDYIKSDSNFNDKNLNFAWSNSGDSGKNSFIYASKRGKKYYFYNCKSSIKETNKIYFKSEDEAKDAGYTLSSSCK